LSMNLNQQKDGAEYKPFHFVSLNRARNWYNYKVTRTSHSRYPMPPKTIKVVSQPRHWQNANWNPNSHDKLLPPYTTSYTIFTLDSNTRKKETCPIDVLKLKQIVSILRLTNPRGPIPPSTCRAPFKVGAS